jgi:predicted HNH restriction endonuclease
VDGKVEVPFRTVGRVPERWNNHHLFKKFRTPFDKEDKRRELRDRLNGIPRIKLNSISLNGRPSFSLSLLEDRDTFNKLVEVFGWYVDEIVTGSTRLLDAGIEAQVQSDLDSLEAEEEEYFEGNKTQRLVNHYERDKNLRAATIKHHGVTCKVCGFDFEKVYGERGKNFIEAHHLIPVSSLGKETSVDPKRDMTVLCSNCHRMIHRRKDDVLTPEELKSLLRVGFEGWTS